MKKVLSVGFITTALSLIVGIVAFVLYFVNISAIGYFQDTPIDNIVLFSIIGLLCLAVALLLQFINAKSETSSRLISILSGLLRVCAVVFIMICMMISIQSRAEGLAYIYGSNPEILATIQTPENLSSAMVAIVSFVLYGVSGLFAIVSSFFSMKKASPEENKSETANA